MSFSSRGALVALSLAGLLSVSATIARAQAPANNSIFDEDPAVKAPPPIPDKIEGFNRAMFKFNDGLYKVTLRPLSKGYAAVVPGGVRRGFSRFFHNLAFPTRFVGNVLEGRFTNAGIETGRFVVNTVSSLGFVATADEIPALKEKPSDIGQAFGTWGIGHGTYVILPLLGPTSVRDGAGDLVSGFYLDPVHYLEEWEQRAAINAFRLVNASPDLIQSYDQLISAAVDPYVALRDAYSVRRSSRIPGKPELPAVPATTSTAPSP